MKYHVAMRYRRLGSTGIEVSAFCLGTMMMGAWGNRDEASCHSMLDIALEAGVNFVDTADVYALGEAETILGRWLARHRDHVVVSTKFGNPMGDSPGLRGGSRRWIVRAVEDSLRRLDTDHIDVYQLHRPDPTCPIEETLSALDALMAAGKVRAIGTSTFPAEFLVEAQWAAARRQLEPFRTEQPPYSIMVRGAEADVLPTCRAHDIGVFVWSPLNRGWLTGKYRRGVDLPEDSRAVRHPDHFDQRGDPFDAKLAVVERLESLASDAGIPLAHLALAFALEHPVVASAIIGPRTPDQLRGLLGAVEVELESAVLDEIDRIVAPGTDISAVDVGWVSTGLDVGQRRRQRRALDGQDR